MQLYGKCMKFKLRMLGAELKVLEAGRLLYPHPTLQLVISPSPSIDQKIKTVNRLQITNIE